MRKSYVGALILNPINEILLQRKDVGYKKWPGYWTTFGGMVEETDKNPLEAIYREVREETGLNLSDISLFEKIYIDESKYGPFGQPNPSQGWCDFFTAGFDGDLSKIALNEGAGFSVWDQNELFFIKDRTFPYVYDLIQRFYESLKVNASQ